LNERGRRTDEMIPLLRQLWTGEAITHEGRHYPMADVKIHPAPLQPGGPPIVVAGRQEAAMRRAATTGDGWFPYLYSPRRYAASVETVKQFAADAGRELVRFEWFAWVFVNIKPDGDVARHEAARSLGVSHGQVDSVAAAGTLEEVSAKVEAFYDAGARHFVFCPATATADAHPVVEQLLEDVVPALREHATVEPG
jgi:alkanesulfonate monooxygenase SsuD/methylene tetrahydromethanopterin reductase-like flavin-dependent oxidoreductase (luciferase family)